MVHPGGSGNSPKRHPGLFGGLLALLLAAGGSRLSQKRTFLTQEQPQDTQRYVRRLGQL
jgi:hypothetical protein